MTKYILTNYSETQSTHTTPVPNSGVVESGVVDSGLIDSGLIDSGLIDSGLIDSGLVDSGLVGSGIVDTNQKPIVNIVVNPGHQQETETPNNPSSDNNEHEQQSDVDHSQSNGNPLLPGGNPSQSNENSSQSGENNPGNSSTNNGVVMYKNGIPIYNYETAIGLCRNGKWDGGYVIGVNPNAVNEIVYMYKENEVWGGAATSGQELLNRAYKFEGVPYDWGGFSSRGVDCSGLVSLVLGLPCKWSTHASGDIPTMKKVPIKGNATDINVLIGQIQPGDVILWRNRHAAFYVGGTTLFHARRKGTLVGKTNDLNWWLTHTFEKNENVLIIPEIYRLK